MNPKVSLIIPFFNRKQFLPAAVDSVLVQTFTDFELLLWDDGSSDGSTEIAHEYARRDPRVRVVVSENRGEPFARSQAVSQTTGPLLGWIDSDDWIAPTCLAEAVAALDANPAVGMVYTDYVVTDAVGKPKGLGTRCTIPYSKERMLVDFMTFHFRLIRRYVYDRAGGLDRNLKAAADYDLCLRLSEITEIHHLRRPLYFYREHGGTISMMRRVDQILASKDAISRALIRRGLADKMEADVQLQGRFTLRRLPAAGLPLPAPRGIPQLIAGLGEMLQSSPPDSISESPADPTET